MSQEQQQKKEGIWSVILPFLLGEASKLIEGVFNHKDIHVDENTLAIKNYLETLGESSRNYVLAQMMNQHLGTQLVKPFAECSNPCTGAGSTPYGHWSHDAQCNCVWVPEFGR